MVLPKVIASANAMRCSISESSIAGEAMRDIAGNVSGKAEWRDYDERYAVQHILRAIREAKGTPAIVTAVRSDVTNWPQGYAAGMVTPLTVTPETHHGLCVRGGKRVA